MNIIQDFEEAKKEQARTGKPVWKHPSGSYAVATVEEIGAQQDEWTKCEVTEENAVWEWIWRPEDLDSLGQEGDVVAEAPTEKEARIAARVICERAKGLILEVAAATTGWAVIASDMSEDEEKEWLEQGKLPYWLHDDIFVYPDFEE
jgi:hypothetical protein